MDGIAGGAFVLQPGEGRAIDVGTTSRTVKADGEATDGAFSLIETAGPPGSGPPLHIHDDAAESFYVLEGEFIVYLDSREVLCPAGSFVYIPAGLPHGFKVGSVPSRKLNLFTPAAMAGYFDELADAARRGTVDPDTLAVIARRHSMRVVGPLPEGYS